MGARLARVGRYTLVRELGRGGMGEVFLAVRAGADRGEEPAASTFALKRLLPQLAEHPEALDLWSDELRLASLLDHPNLARIVEVGEDRGLPYLVMEYVNGMSVRALIERHQALRSRVPARVAVRIAAQVADALAYAHAFHPPETGAALQLVHRDVSPRNILLGTQGEVNFIDFGVAKTQIQEHRSVVGRPKGKPEYMSPEQAVGRPLDARSDQFSLGIVLAEMLAGGHPFSGSTSEELAKSIRSGSPLLPGEVDARLAALDPVVARALAKRPHDRFPHAAAFAEALRSASAQLPPSAVKLDRLVSGLLDEEAVEISRSLAKAGQRWREGSGSGDLSELLAAELAAPGHPGRGRRR